MYLLSARHCVRYYRLKGEQTRDCPCLQGISNLVGVSTNQRTTHTMYIAIVISAPKGRVKGCYKSLYWEVWSHQWKAGKLFMRTG